MQLIPYILGHSDEGVEIGIGMHSAILMLALRIPHYLTPVHGLQSVLSKEYTGG